MNLLNVFDTNHADIFVTLLYVNLSIVGLT